MTAGKKQQEGDLFSWTEELSVGIGNIDVQHMTFISLINDVYRCLTEPRNAGGVRGVLTDLIDYANVHFAEEEVLFERYAYPAAAEHKKEHAKFLARVLAYHEELVSSDTQLPVSVSLFMKNWLTEHIAVSDQKYARFFREKKIEV